MSEPIEPDEDGHCKRCGYLWNDERDTLEPHRCPPGFLTDADRVAELEREIAQLKRDLSAVRGGLIEWFCESCSTVFPNSPDKLYRPCPKCGTTLLPSSFNLREISRMRAEIAQLKRDAERKADRAISDLAQIYGLIEEGKYDEAQDYCKGSAEMYTQELADAALAQEQK